MKNQSWVDIKNNLDKILNGELEILGSNTLKGHLVKNNILEYKCNQCGIKEWKNKPITLDLEHIDGNRRNNKRNNLELLCPNCHSQTPTYKRKNKLRKNNIILDEKDIIERIKKGEPIKNILINYGLNYEGNSYSRIYKICIKNNLEIPSYNPSKIEQLARDQVKNELKYLESIEKNKQLILNSNIDFSKPGWRLEVSKILNCSPQYVFKWFQTYMLDFYNKNCWSHKKNKQLKENITKERELKKQKLEEQIELINNNIDFSLPKWKEKVAQLLNINYYSVNSWIKNYFSKKYYYKTFDSFIKLER